jgi:DNA-binding transcriptional LysR family regulator
MELGPRHLRLIITLADLRSETAAADELGLSQPAVSMQLRRIERWIGVPLFTRRPRGLVVTAEGEALIEHARRAHLELTGFELAVSRARDRSASAFTVTSVAYGAGDATSAILGRFGAAEPGLVVELRQTDLGDRLAGLPDGRSDVALTMGPLSHPDVEQRLLFEDPVVVAVAAGSRLAARTRVHIQDLLDEPIIVGLESDEVDDPDWHRFWAADVFRGGRPARVGGRYTTPEMHLSAVAMGQGISLMTSRTLDFYHRSGVAFLPVEGMPPVPHWIAWHRHAVRPRLVRRFVEVALDVIGAA